MNSNLPTAPVKPRRRILRKFLLGAAILFGVLLVCFVAWRIQLRREINARIAVIRADGLPINWEELSKWNADVPDGENAALIYLEVIAQLHSETIPGFKLGTEPDFAPRGKSIPAESRDLMEVAIQTNRPALEIIYTAKSFSKSHYPLDFSNGPNTPLPHLAGLKGLTWLLECDALLNANSGNATKAANAVIASMAVARSLDGEPCLISQLAAMSMFAISRQSLEKILCRLSLSEESLAQLSTQLAFEDATNRLIVGLIGDRALNVEFIRLAQDDVRRMVEIANSASSDEEKTELPKSNPGFFWRALGFFERDRAFYLRAMEAHLAMARIQPPESLASTNEIDRISAKAKSDFYFLSGLLLPSNLAFKDADHHAYLRTALAATAVERWRLSHGGNLPESLDALVPAYLTAVPVDPFSGRPLRFKKLEHGYVVYSIGRNMEDDDGRERPSPKIKLPPDERNRFDITFTVER